LPRDNQDENACGYASRDNLMQAKAIGVSDVAFHKKCGLNVEDMVKSKRVYRKLRDFRAGIEAGISRLMRAYGLTRCTGAASITSSPMCGRPSLQTISQSTLASS
jgi:hypothetical protein